MVKFFFLTFAHPVVNWAYFGVALDDRNPNPVLYWF